MDKRKKRARRKSLLRRLLEEMEDFVRFYRHSPASWRAAEKQFAEILEKALEERIIRFTSPPRSRFHQKVVEILKQYFKSDKKQTKVYSGVLEKSKVEANGGNTRMALRCSLCYVEDDDVARIPEDVKILGKARDVVGDDEIPDVLIVDVPVKNLCPYCADVVGVKHPDPEIVERVKYYTDLMKVAIPKVQENLVPPESKPKIDVDKLHEVLVMVQDTLTKLARRKEEEGELPEVESADMYPEEPEEVVSGWKRSER